VKGSNHFQILRELIDYTIYGEIDDTIRTGSFQKKKMLLWTLVFVILPMMVESAVLETTKMV
jgi:hypothetical protein